MLSLTRHTKLRSEAYAAYLMSSRNPDWVQPKVVTPTHYLVGRPVLFYPGSEELQLIPIHELKKTIRENAALGGTDLRCYGLVMDKAPGHEVAKQMNALSQNPNQRAMITQSGLEALRGLSARGFVHRDIKPANMIFNGKELNFIDTGMLFKTHKTPAEKGLAEESLDPAVVDLEHVHQLPTLRAGTPVYMHPDLAAGQKGYIGTQADLHAIGLITLEMEAPTVFAAMKGILGQVNSNKKFPPITARTFEQTLDLVIAHALTPAADKNSAEALKVNMKNPQHLANLGFECLQKANTSMPDNSAARWANREFADQQYAQLLQHPALAARNGVAA